MSFENPTGLVTNQTYAAWYQQYRELPPLVALVKLYLNMRGFDDPSVGGIGGFTATCLCVYLLHNWRTISGRQSSPGANMGFLLYKFFDFYGHGASFDMQQKSINMNTMRLDHKQSPDPSLVVLDPDNSSNNIAKASRNAAMIFAAFNDAFKRLDLRLREASKTLARPWHKQARYVTILFAVLWLGAFLLTSDLQYPRCPVRRELQTVRRSTRPSGQTRGTVVRRGGMPGGSSKYTYPVKIPMLDYHSGEQKDVQNHRS